MTCIMNVVHLSRPDVELFLELIFLKINSNQCCSVSVLVLKYKRKLVAGTNVPTDEIKNPTCISC